MNSSAGSRGSRKRPTARAPYAPNLIVHKTNTRLHEDVKLVEKYAPAMVITSVGSPAPVMDAIHAANGLVFADVASMRHVERALAVGVDGLILLTAGAGGQTGWANPLAFVRAVRSVFDGPVVLAGGVADGVALRAAIVLGCDLAYMGTRFIATQQSLAAPAYKDMLVTASLDDIVLSRALTGLETNLLRPSVELAGMDTTGVGSLDAGAAGVAANAPRRWKDVWSAGHTVAQVHDLPDVADLVDRIAAEYAAAMRADGDRRCCPTIAYSISPTNAARCAGNCWRTSARKSCASSRPAVRRCARRCRAS